MAEVEIDPATGETRIVNYVVVDDFGATLNPLLLAGQVHGGTAQGIGQALMERTSYDSDSGQLVSASLLDYAVPRADEVPAITFETRNVRCLHNPLGVKGAGEAGAIGLCPAVMNAIVDALWRELRIAHLDMPATPERVWMGERASSVPGKAVVRRRDAAGLLSFGCHSLRPHGPGRRTEGRSVRRRKSEGLDGLFENYLGVLRPVLVPICVFYAPRMSNTGLLAIRVTPSATLPSAFGALCVQSGPRA